MFVVNSVALQTLSLDSFLRCAVLYCIIWTFFVIGHYVFQCHPADIIIRLFSEMHCILVYCMNVFFAWLLHVSCEQCYPADNIIRLLSETYFILVYCGLLTINYHIISRAFGLNDTMIYSRVSCYYPTKLGVFCWRFPHNIIY